ncbi:helix-turn-helix transcriptional regulator [bacterium]|nr:helix-turn-helix transcriptional regulator [bacterium]
MSIKKLLGKRLQEIRKAKKLTQEQVAEMIGVETPSISNIENGKYYPGAENLDKLMQALGIRPNELFNCECFAEPKELIAEMLTSMQNDEKLTRLMYKFYSGVKY